MAENTESEYERGYKEGQRSMRKNKIMGLIALFGMFLLWTYLFFQ